MSTYNPDKWLVVKITGPDYPIIYKVFACWYGGYTGSDSWKLNSGITSVSKEGDVYSFAGSSGSVYTCHTNSYGANSYGYSVLQDMIATAEANNVIIQILPEDTDWGSLDYEYD